MNFSQLLVHSASHHHHGIDGAEEPILVDLVEIIAWSGKHDTRPTRLTAMVDRVATDRDGLLKDVKEYNGTKFR